MHKKVAQKRSVIELDEKSDVYITLPSSNNDGCFIITQNNKEIQKGRRFDVILNDLKKRMANFQSKPNIYTIHENGNTNKIDL